MTFKIALAAGAAAAAFVATAPAGAVITTFATFSALSSDDNFRYVNSGNSAVRTNDATFYSTATKNSTSPGSVNVRFSFLEPEFAAYVTNITAKFTLTGSVAKGSPASAVGSYVVQPNVGGSFSFVTTAPITVGGPFFVPHTYATGSVLLSGTFTNGTISGATTSGSAADSSVTAGSTVTFASDFLDFTPVNERDLSISLTSILPNLAPATGVNKALKGFRAVAGGQFSSDPAPLINGIVPEPGVWVMMIAGFGLVGVSARRRGRVVTA